MSDFGTLPYNKAVAISTSDTVNFDKSTQTQVVAGNKAIPCDAIYVGGAGTVTPVLESGVTGPTFTCVAGQTLPFKAIRVNATGTAGTLLIALYYV